MLRRHLMAGLVVLVLSGAMAGHGVTAVDSISLGRISRHVQAGAYQSLTVTVIPRARCTIAVGEASIGSSVGLGARTGGRITWRWKIREGAPAGNSRVVVNCSKSGAAKLNFMIIPAQPAISLDEAKAVICQRAEAFVQEQFGGTVVRLPPAQTSSKAACSFTVHGLAPQDQDRSRTVSLFVGSSAPCLFEVASSTAFLRPYTLTCKDLRQ
jgi:hypothetical protein